MKHTKHEYRHTGELFAFKLAQTIMDNFVFHGEFHLDQQSIMEQMNISKQNFYNNCVRKAEVIEQVGLYKIKDGKENIWYLDIKKFLNYLIQKYKA